MPFDSSTRKGFATALGVAVTALVAAVGCESRVKLAPATGRVFLGEEPLAFGRVMFQPMQGGQPATAEIAADGRFELSTYAPGDGVPVGRHRVRVVCYTSQDPKAETEEPLGDSLGDLLIPERYASFTNSGIEVSVLAGGNAPFIIKLEPDPVTEDEASDDEPTAEDEQQATAPDEAAEPAASTEDAE